MMYGRKDRRKNCMALIFLGSVLLAVVMLVPDAGRYPGIGFIFVAQQTSWEKWGDWPAAWCATKIILFNLGIFCLMLGAREWLSEFPFSWISRVAAYLVVLPILGAWIGIYYLAKSVL